MVHCLFWTAWSWRWRHFDPIKCHKQCNTSEVLNLQLCICMWLEWGFLNAKVRIYSGNTNEGLNLILKRFADWICQTCHVCWFHLSNMPCVLIGSVEHAMRANWICQICHVCWLGLWSILCMLIGSVRCAMWADWICQTCHEGWSNLSHMPYVLTGSVKHAVCADWIC